MYYTVNSGDHKYDTPKISRNTLVFHEHARELYNVQSKRAGIVPYVIKDNQIYFLFARDSKTNEITDCGGGVKLDEPTILGAIREFSEETCHAFPNLSNAKLIGSYPAVTYKNTSIIFVRLADYYFDFAQSVVSNAIELYKSRGKEYQEITTVMWISGHELQNLISEGASELWARVRNFYNKSLNAQFWKLLKKQPCIM